MATESPDSWRCYLVVVVVVVVVGGRVVVIIDVALVVLVVVGNSSWRSKLSGRRLTCRQTRRSSPAGAGMVLGLSLSLSVSLSLSQSGGGSINEKSCLSLVGAPHLLLMPILDAQCMVAPPVYRVAPSRQLAGRPSGRRARDTHTHTLGLI